MEKGKLLEEGRHSDLIAKNGRYKAMWENYTASIEWKL